MADEPLRLFAIAAGEDTTSTSSSGRPRTNYAAKARNLLAAGIHPATRAALFIGTGETCEQCASFVAYDFRHNRRLFKCRQHRLGVSRSEASDIRKSWPACALFTPTDEDPT